VRLPIACDPRAEAHIFRSSAGAHLLIVDGSRIYDVDRPLADQLEAGLVVGDGRLAPEATDLWSAALGLFSDRRLPRYIDGRPLDPPPLYSISLNVAHCYPGLEFDQRNLDKAFFPGLVFEFHRSDGAILHRIVPGGLPALSGLTDGDNPRDRPLFLWAVIGRTTAEQSDDDPPVLFFHGLNGLEVWRRVHDLLPGRIAILLGPAPGFSALPPNIGVLQLLDELRDAGQNRIQRDDTGLIEFGVFVGDRARYVDAEGVIDVDVFEPGELTRSLCAPWQFDFRDCGCFYWAASKPDLVASADGEDPYLNFMRRHRAIRPAPSEVLQQWVRDQELDYQELIAGAWNELPVVLNDRESERFVPSPAPSVPLLMTREQVVAELRYLATVEHALCVEYLYSHYSLAAPLSLPPDEADAAIAGARPLRARPTMNLPKWTGNQDRSLVAGGDSV
jgi:hypothetical protein